MFFQLDKDHGPRKHNKPNKTLPSTETSPLYPLNNIIQNFPLNEYLKCQYSNKIYKTETGLNRRKAKYKERNKPSDNNKYNTPSISNGNYTTASQIFEYPWSQTGNTIQQLPKYSSILGHKRVILSRLTPSTQYTINLFSGVKTFSFYPQVHVERDILKKQLEC